MLEISALVGGYGRITILRGVDLKVARGELVALVGVNGAGKTTLMKSIAGLLQTAGGRISFDGVDITGKGTESTSVTTIRSGSVGRLGSATTNCGRPSAPRLPKKH